MGRASKNSCAVMKLERLSLGRDRISSHQVTGMPWLETDVQSDFSGSCSRGADPQSFTCCALRSVGLASMRYISETAVKNGRNV